MNEKPTICVSKCLGFEPCRYNGAAINDAFIDNLKRFVNFIPVCPELELGLGVPREALRIVKEHDELQLIQPKTERYFTEPMLTFTESFLNSIEDIDGFILKSRSPSCGTKDVKIYSSAVKGGSSEKGPGFFSMKVIEKFPEILMEDEGRLSNYKIREHFLTELFALYNFKRIKTRNSIDELMKYHAINNLLFMAYNQKEFKILDKIAANHENQDIKQVLSEYETHLKLLFKRSARYTSNINVLQYSIGYFNKFITEDEITFLADSIEKYRKGKLPLSTPVYLVKSYAIRFDLSNLKNQTFFNPFPEELIELRDSGKGIN
jgi:uncharacterized protein YbgA (DUF1722 family)/uncharacterized protein YbbK (DUF523 family)